MQAPDIWHAAAQRFDERTGHHEPLVRRTGTPTSGQVQQFCGIPNQPTTTQLLGRRHLRWDGNDEVALRSIACTEVAPGHLDFDALTHRALAACVHRTGATGIVARAHKGDALAFYARLIDPGRERGVVQLEG